MTFLHCDLYRENQSFFFSQNCKELNARFAVMMQVVSCHDVSGKSTKLQVVRVKTVHFLLKMLSFSCPLLS